MPTSQLIKIACNVFNNWDHVSKKEKKQDIKLHDQKLASALKPGEPRMKPGKVRTPQQKGSNFKGYPKVSLIKCAYCKQQGYWKHCMLLNQDLGQSGASNYRQ